MFIGVNQNYWAINNGALVNHDFNHSTTGYRNLCSKRIKLMMVFIFEFIDFSDKIFIKKFFLISN